MTKPVTQGERLTRIEVLLEQAVSQRHEDRDAMRKTIDEMASDIRQIKTDLAADKAEMAALKNKGVGLLIGAGLAGGATWEAIKAAFGAFK
jgi:predicted  nucleic acid-binding Zn-ribbon protein